VDRALEQTASIETVSGAAAATLMNPGCGKCQNWEHASFPEKLKMFYPGLSRCGSLSLDR
jgi:hypothetical protein